MSDRKKFIIILLGFLSIYFIPFGNERVKNAVTESFLMLHEYARDHILLCLVPAFFIAGAIAVFLSKDSVIKYFGSSAKKIVSYSVASVSGTILAVCSCTILPLFAGIYKRGAGLGPAITLLYSGPAINILAIILTAKVLGWEIGAARAAGAIIFGIVIGLIMNIIFRNDEKNKEGFILDEKDDKKPNSVILLYFLSMILILVFANWSRGYNYFWNFIYSFKWLITGFWLTILILVMLKWFKKRELQNWVQSTWSFAQQILPLLFIGVLIAGFLMGRAGQNGIIPNSWIQTLVGGNSIQSNFFASVVGAFMYFATLTEIPILEGLLNSGMGKGPALALLLSGPALSLPNMLVIKSIIGWKKTIVFVCMVIIFSMIFGIFFGSIA